MFNIPTVTRNLLIINVVAFILCVLYGANVYDGVTVYRLNSILGLHFFFAPDFHIYQLFTYMFMHAGFEHIFFNMLMLWMFGCVVERVWGAKKFLFYYICCGVGAGLFQELAQFMQFYFFTSNNYPGVEFTTIVKAAGSALNGWTTVGASGAIYAILLAFGMTFSEEKMFFFPFPIPINAKWFVVICAGIELFLSFTSTGDHVAHVAHLGGMIFGFFMIKYWQHHPDSAYKRSAGQQFFDNLRTRWENHTQRKSNNNQRYSTNNKHESDWDYNVKKQRRQEEIDRILDKIRKSGYDSLSSQEKQTLFDSSKE